MLLWGLLFVLLFMLLQVWIGGEGAERDRRASVSPVNHSPPGRPHRSARSGPGADSAPPAPGSSPPRRSLGRSDPNESPPGEAGALNWAAPTVVVLDSDEKPVAGVPLRLVRAGGRAEWTRSGDDGRATFTGPPPRLRAKLEVGAPYFALGGRRTWPPDERRPVRIHVQEGAELRGRVTLADGRAPVSPSDGETLRVALRVERRVALEPGRPDRSESFWSTEWEGRIDGPWAFAIGGLRPGSKRLILTARRGNLLQALEREFDVRAGEHNDLVLELPDRAPLLEIRGELVDTQGAPLRWGIITDFAQGAVPGCGGNQQGTSLEVRLHSTRSGAQARVTRTAELALGESLWVQGLWESDLLVEGLSRGPRPGSDRDDRSIPARARAIHRSPGGVQAVRLLFVLGD